MVTSPKIKCIHMKILVAQYYSFLPRWSDPNCTEVSIKLLLNLLGFRSNHEAILPAEFKVPSKEKHYSSSSFVLLKKGEIKTGTSSRLTKQLMMRMIWYDYHISSLKDLTEIYTVNLLFITSFPTKLCRVCAWPCITYSDSS